MIRVILGGLLGYLLIGILIAAADLILPKGPYYCQVVLITTTIFKVTGGWPCGLISLGDTLAAWGLIVMGEVMGVVSTIYVWHTAPHYYSSFLLIMYPPAVWFGANRLAPPAPAAHAPRDAGQSHSSPER